MTWLLLGFFVSVMCLIALGGYLLARLRPVALAGNVPANLVSSALVSLGGKMARSGKTAESLRKQLFRAGYRSPTGSLLFHGIQACLAGSAALATGWLAAVNGEGLLDALLPAVCGAGIGFLLPSRVLGFQVKARARRIRSAIPVALDLLVLALEAGQSLDQAMKDTALSLRELHPDLSAEFVLCHLEMSAGSSRGEALRRLGERSGEDELRKLATVLIDGERFGTTLGPALRTHARYLRARMRQRAQESARKLGVKLVIPVFFLIFPSVLLVTLGPAYLQMREFLKTFLN
jgi:tight adherence protein C